MNTGKKSRLQLTGNDSVMYEIKTDVYQNCSKEKEILDFSNYSTKSKYYDNSNKLVTGKMKDKTGGFTIK